MKKCILFGGIGVIILIITGGLLYSFKQPPLTCPEGYHMGVFEKTFTGYIGDGFPILPDKDDLNYEEKLKERQEEVKHTKTIQTYNTTIGPFECCLPNNKEPEPFDIIYLGKECPEGYHYVRKAVLGPTAVCAPLNYEANRWIDGNGNLHLNFFEIRRSWSKTYYRIKKLKITIDNYITQLH